MTLIAFVCIFVHHFRCVYADIHTAASPYFTPLPKKKTMRNIFDVILPGTHDSGAYAVPLSYITPLGAPTALAARPFSYFLRQTLCDFSKTQYNRVLYQLRAGSRYQDFRIAPTNARKSDLGANDRFWMVHGVVACVPLSDVLEDMRTFTLESMALGRAPTVVTVVRLEGSAWDDASKEALKEGFYEALGRKHIYGGSPSDLRETSFDDLPPHLVAGVPGIGKFPHANVFGSDIWINTYDLEVKRKGLEKQLRMMKPRWKRNDLFVFGWTVTPQPQDIAKRLLSCGLARPSLETKAKRFNGEFEEFMSLHSEALMEKVNVVFFDFMTRDLADVVWSLNELDEEMIVEHEEGMNEGFE